MARFLFVTWDGGGTVPPAFGIAQALHEGGHEAVFAGQELMPATGTASTGRGLLEARAAAHGFRFARLERSSAAWLKESPEHRIVTAVMASREHLRDLPDAIAQEGCDVLVIDGLMFGALAAAEGIDLPTAVLVTSAPSATAAPGGPLDARLLAAVNEVRAAGRRAPVDRLWDAWARFPTLCTTIPELDPLADQTPPSFAYAGPVFERVPKSGWRQPWPVDDPRPLVLVSFTTTDGWDQTSRIQHTLAALADGPYRVLVTAGRAAAAGFVVPGNATLVPHVPHGEVLPLASAVVTHAGHGTVVAALAHGVPLVCLPNPGTDQPALARRVEDLGVGQALSGEAASPGEIKRAVDDVLAGPSYAAAAGRLARAIAATPGDATAVSLLEPLVRHPRRPPSVPVPAHP